MNEAPKTWDDVRDWDDLIPEKTKKLISELKVDGNACPHLGKMGNHFYYCKPRADQIVEFGFGEFSDKPKFESAQYKAVLDIAEIQLYCLDCDGRKNCIFFPEDKRGE